MTLPFIPEKVYNRRNDIHKIFGGNWQGGICPSSSHPYIFIFTGKSGNQHGYEDGWDNPDIFSYTGEGQVGDMKFTRGNLALREHLQQGKRVFLFEFFAKGFVKFISEVEFHDVDYFETKDTTGNLRLGIKFFFKRKGAYVPAVADWIVSDSASNLLISSPTHQFPNKTERSGLITSRVGQGAYRKRIIHRWEYQCAVTGFNKLDILVASHILPWKDSTDQQRLDVNNGILLSPTYDALFDRHLISFENNGEIILSPAIAQKAYDQIGVTPQDKISKPFSDDNKWFMDQHRQQLVL